MDNKKGIIEGLLFITGDDGIVIEKLSEVLETPVDEVRTILEEMAEEYRSNDVRGIELVAYGGKYKLVSKESIGEYAKKLYEIIPTNNFSPAALETLAIIAYKQPITRTQIEEIRGVGCDTMIQKLIARDLIRECGRSDAPGRPFLYEVTPTFMDSFKLESLSELPELPSFEQKEEKELFE